MHKKEAKILVLKKGKQINPISRSSFLSHCLQVELVGWLHEEIKLLNENLSDKNILAGKIIMYLPRIIFIKYKFLTHNFNPF